MDFNSGPKSTDEWSSPQAIVDICAQRWGPFDLDAAADETNAQAPAWINRFEDGLTRPWNGRVWLNPPWCRRKRMPIGPWIDKSVEEALSGRVALVCALVPASVSTRWWHRLAANATRILLLKGRLRYGDGGSAKFGSCVALLCPFGGPARIDVWDPRAEMAEMKGAQNGGATS